MWNFLPLSEQYDGGLGATADSYHEAAKHLSSAGDLFLHQHLPICFLLRHAIELYLKSAIVILHRKFVASGSVPQLMLEGRLRPVFTIHSIRALHDSAAGAFAQHQDQLDRCTRTDWNDAFTLELASAVEVIDAADKKGTFFRYPDSGNEAADRDKSGIKRYDLDELSRLPERAPGASFLKAFLAYDSNDEIVASYGVDHEVVSDIREKLDFAAEHLSAVHFAMRAEITREM